MDYFIFTRHFFREITGIDTRKVRIYILKWGQSSLLDIEGIYWADFSFVVSISNSADQLPHCGNLLVAGRRCQDARGMGDSVQCSTFA